MSFFTTLSTLRQDSIQPTRDPDKKTTPFSSEPPATSTATAYLPPTHAATQARRSSLHVCTAVDLSEQPTCTPPHEASVSNAKINHGGDDGGSMTDAADHRGWPCRAAVSFGVAALCTPSGEDERSPYPDLRPRSCRARLPFDEDTSTETRQSCTRAGMTSTAMFTRSPHETELQGANDGRRGFELDASAPKSERREAKASGRHQGVLSAGSEWAHGQRGVVRACTWLQDRPVVGEQSYGVRTRASRYQRVEERLTSGILPEASPLRSCQDLDSTPTQPHPAKYKYTTALRLCRYVLVGCVGPRVETTLTRGPMDVLRGSCGRTADTKLATGDPLAPEAIGAVSSMREAAGPMIQNQEPEVEKSTEGVSRGDESARSTIAEDSEQRGCEHAKTSVAATGRRDAQRAMREHICETSEGSKGREGDDESGARVGLASYPAQRGCELKSPGSIRIDGTRRETSETAYGTRKEDMLNVVSGPRERHVETYRKESGGNERRSRYERRATDFKGNLCVRSLDESCTENSGKDASGLARRHPVSETGRRRAGFPETREDAGPSRGDGRVIEEGELEASAGQRQRELGAGDLNCEERSKAQSEGAEETPASVQTGRDEPETSCRAMYGLRDATAVLSTLHGTTGAAWRLGGSVCWEAGQVHDQRARGRTTSDAHLEPDPTHPRYDSDSIPTRLPRTRRNEPEARLDEHVRQLSTRGQEACRRGADLPIEVQRCDGFEHASTRNGVRRSDEGQQRGGRSKADEPESIQNPQAREPKHAYDVSMQLRRGGGARLGSGITCVQTHAIDVAVSNSGDEFADGQRVSSVILKARAEGSGAEPARRERGMKHTRAASEVQQARGVLRDARGREEQKERASVEMDPCEQDVDQGVRYGMRGVLERLRVLVNSEGVRRRGGGDQMEGRRERSGRTEGRPTRAEPGRGAPKPSTNATYGLRGITRRLWMLGDLRAGWREVQGQQAEGAHTGDVCGRLPPDDSRYESTSASAEFSSRVEASEVPGGPHQLRLPPSWSNQETPRDERDVSASEWKCNKSVVECLHAGVEHALAAGETQRVQGLVTGNRGLEGRKEAARAGSSAPGGLCPNAETNEVPKDSDRPPRDWSTQGAPKCERNVSASGWGCDSVDSEALHPGVECTRAAGEVQRVHEHMKDRGRDERKEIRLGAIADPRGVWRRGRDILWRSWLAKRGRAEGRLTSDAHLKAGPGYSLSTRLLSAREDELQACLEERKRRWPIRGACVGERRVPTTRQTDEGGDRASRKRRSWPGYEDQQEDGKSRAGRPSSIQSLRAESERACNISVLHQSVRGARTSLRLLCTQVHMLVNFVTSGSDYSTNAQRGAGKLPEYNAPFSSGATDET
ncbi:hypothetical protein FOMPIDRAFT_1018059 [Fomitopsis schrenkii]|uniref:Uncharacterized protein n=1 Tax=Fomitopsis schrenkii TaxID=2126942 RepID=S8F8E4_FOMSC|nr:hypothetical protein FOMPIDRAFT_1018059 [Fomitopsis schrenkii]